MVRTGTWAMAPSTAAVPHRAWYERHRAAIDEEATAIRSLVAQLSTAPDPYVAPNFSFLLERTPKAEPEEPRAWRKDEYPD